MGIRCCFATLLLMAGCSPSHVGEVSGRVTLNGQPLPDALVVFQPVASGGPSYARTDADGAYTLTYTPEIEGAEIGEHTIRVTSGSPGDPDAKPPMPPVPERVPAKYNAQSELKREVKPGSNTIDLWR
jgi:hypothetical protein